MAQTDYNYKELVATSPIPSAVGAVFTNPASKITNVALMIIHNASTTSIQNVKLYKVANAAGSVGVAAGAGTSAVNEIFNENIDPGGTFTWEFSLNGRLLFEAENDSLQAVADTANTVTITIGGGQETIS